MYSDIDGVFDDVVVEVPAVDYDLLGRQVEGLSRGVHWLGALANASALIMQTLPLINWAGFYLSESYLGVSDDKTSLLLGPFQGKVACCEIAHGRGVCGTAVLRDQSVLVADVHQFAGHIACDEASRSEIVVPLHRGDELIGVLDIDSPVRERFDALDQAGLEMVVTALEDALFG